MKKNNRNQRIVFCHFSKPYKLKFRAFIKKYWNKSHIFSKENKIFDWLYRSKYGKYNFIICVKEKKIISFQGFIPQSQFDNKLPLNQFFLSFWYSISVGTGLKIYFKILNICKPQFVGSLGMNEKSFIFHKWQGFNVGKLNHHFMLSDRVNKFKIIKKKNYKIKKLIRDKNFLAYKYLDINFLKKNKNKKIFMHQVPAKSNSFLINRYLKHPKYKYGLYGVFEKNKLIVILVTRICIRGKNSAIRIVDYIGKNTNFHKIKNLLIDLIYKFSSEYVDFYSYGIPNKYINKSGLRDRYKLKNKIIVPNYFEPLVKKNIDILYGFKSKKFKRIVRLFKGDSDQDRPNK